MKPNDEKQTSLAPAPVSTLAPKPPSGGYPVYSRYPALQFEKNSLRQYWRIIRNRKWAVLTTLVVLLTIVTIGTLLTRPVYRAEVKVEIGRETERIMSGQRIADVETANVFNPLYLQTQVDILRSRDLARRVIQRLNLAEHEEFKNKSAELSTLSENERDTLLINGFQRRYDVSVGRLSRVVSLTFEAHDPKLAAEVANALAREYIDWSMESGLQGVESAKAFLEKRVREAEEELRKSEAAFQQYAAEHKIISLDDRGNITLERTAELNRQLAELQNERRAAEALYYRSLEVPPDELPPVINDPTVQTLARELNKQKQELANLLVRYQPAYPAVKQVQEQIEQLEMQLREAKHKIVRNIETQYRVARKREQDLMASLTQSKEEAIRQNREAIELNMLKQKLDTDRKIYDDLLQQLRRAGVEAEFRPSNIRLVQSAEVPLFPVRPNKPLNIGLSLVIGLVLGVGLAFFLEYLDNTINTGEDVERYLQLPPLGAIPSLQSLVQRKIITAPDSQSHPALARPTEELLLTHEPLLSFAESYRALRTSLLLSSAEHAPHSILITSSHPAEGKTTIVANTAISLAQTGMRVLVLDADMRRPRCHRILGLKNEVGLSTYLSRGIALESVIQEHEVPNLYVLTAGPVPPNPAELLSSSKLRVLMEELRSQFDHIVVDSPPITHVTDALIVSPLVEGVVIVVKGGETPREVVMRTKQALLDVNAKIFGVILNCIDPSKEGYYRYHHYYYSSYGENGK